MKQRRIAFSLVLAGACLALAAMAWAPAPAAAGPAAQVTFTPRPQLTPLPTTLPKTDGPSEAHPPRLHGTIFDWGKGNVSEGVQVVLRGDGWEIPVSTNEEGQYAFLDIGNEIAFLDVVVPEGHDDLGALTSGLPVRVEVGGELVVNVALYPLGTTPDTLLGLKVVSSSSEAVPNENVSFTITAVNNWDEGINQVIVADFLPDGLSYVSASVSQGSAVYEEGLVWADLGPMAAGDSATVTIITKVDADAAESTEILNVVAAYHSENAAVQEETSVVVVEYKDGVLPVTGLAPVLPFAALFLVGLLLMGRKMRRGAV